MEKFKAGNVVVQKSATWLKMAVEGYDDLGLVICKWYDSNKKEWKQDTFVEETLELSNR